MLNKKLSLFVFVFMLLTHKFAKFHFETKKLIYKTKLTPLLRGKLSFKQISMNQSNI